MANPGIQPANRRVMGLTKRVANGRKRLNRVGGAPSIRCTLLAFSSDWRMTPGRRRRMLRRMSLFGASAWRQFRQEARRHEEYP
jgi:hypothetical protein